MTIRRQLVNLGSSCIDYRVGAEAFDELPQIIRRIAGSSKRAVLVCEAGLGEEFSTAARRALVDSGYAVCDLVLDPADAASLAGAQSIFALCSEAGVTADDLIVAAGGMEVCSVASFAATVWCGGVPCALLPSTLEAMADAATAMRPLADAGTEALLSLRSRVDLVVCDLSLLINASDDDVRAALTSLVIAALADSKRVWNKLPDMLEGLLERDLTVWTDALCLIQTSRAAVIKAANPSARNAFQYGLTTALALRACLGADIPGYRLVAEGARFEARLAHDVNGLEVDTVFAIDDALFDLGIEELPFTLEPERFIAALKAVRFRRHNRFMLALPKNPGSIRLSSVDDELLERHAAAFLSSRAELAEELHAASADEPAPETI